MELLQLIYFCDAAKTQNFSKTAKRFFVPTSCVSQSIKRLETELGCELFEHRKNKILLAETGRRFFEKAQAALSLLDQARHDLSAASDRISGEIKLLIFCNRRVVTHAIERFKAAYPTVNFILRHEQDAALDFDILISDVCPPDYEQRAILVGEDILLALRRDHPLAARAALTIEDLRDERFISMPKGRSLYAITMDICRSGNFEPNISIQTDDPHYIRQYVALGLGIAFVPACSWQGLFSDEVVLKKIGAYTRKTYVCLPKSHKPKAAVSAFLQDLLA